MRCRVFVTGMRTTRSVSDATLKLCEAGVAVFEPRRRHADLGDSDYRSIAAADRRWIEVSDAVLVDGAMNTESHEDWSYAHEVGKPVFDSVKDILRFCAR